MLIKSVETLRDYTTKKSKHFVLLAFLSKVTAYRVKSHLNRVLSYLSLSIKTSVVLCLSATPSFSLLGHHQNLHLHITMLKKSHRLGLTCALCISLKLNFDAFLNSTLNRGAWGLVSTRLSRNSQLFMSVVQCYSCEQEFAENFTYLSHGELRNPQVDKPFQNSKTFLCVGFYTLQ